ncbi:hypothetical protein BD560DRAFT_347208 [Blakeslea trispora]|nr:hypothetical protein BD560DRAFT_347208 [Blakeslea trispora]
MVDPESDNKQHQQQRPRLGYLRSAWTTTDLYLHRSLTSISSSTSDQTEEDEQNIYHIKLPAIQLHSLQDEDDDKDELLRELFRMITIVNLLLLLTALFACNMIFWSLPPWQHLKIHYHEWMPHVILPLYVLWWSFMILVLRNKTEHLRQYLNWTQTSTVIMAFTNYLVLYQHIEFVAIPLLSTLVFAFVKRLWIANEAKTERLKQHVMSEHNRLQQYVDQHTEDFSQHRLAFLTTVSEEIQDVALMVITTLEQFSPSSILSSAHELLSACSIAVPIASISAINTTVRQICHISSHLNLLSRLTQQAWSRNGNLIPLPKLNYTEFDIGELLQNMGDALAGVASKLDVKFVLYHCDSQLHHSMVIGDEGAIRHALLNHLRNILECCTPGACIEVGLNVTPTKDPQQSKISFYITHTSSPAIRNANAALLPNANLTAQLLSYISASSTVQENMESNQTRFEFSFELKQGRNENLDNNKMFISRDSFLLKNHYANVKFSNEPSLKELVRFIEQLKGIKMVLHAPEQSIFAKHLTSCLASWNTDISHVPVASRQSSAYEAQPSSGPSTPSSMMSQADVSSENQQPSNSGISSPASHTRLPATPPVPSPATEEEHIHAIPPAFVLIDDDISTLENKLAEFHSQPPVSATALQAYHNRRALHHHHHHHSKKASINSHQNFFHQGTTAIIHFTSLTKYEAVRDTVQSYALLPSRDPFSMPRVVVVPKPAGPRRFLTALHTAWHNAVVEPHFSAIATSPSSPMPPVISMLVQREMSQLHSNAPSPSELARLSPSSLGQTTPTDSPSGGNSTTPNRRNNRPLSGVFSTPPADNYFTSHQPQSQQHEQLSPSFSTNRRRSANNNTVTEDYMTAKHLPLINALGVASSTSPAVAIAAASVAAAISSHTTPIEDSIAHKEGGACSPAVAHEEQKIKSDVVPVDTTDELTTPSPANPIVNESKDGLPKKKVSNTIKLHKKKKKSKGTPFADVVSPPINVLIVEDNIINQAILSTWMKKHKIKFSVASNGKEAVDKWRKGGFHLILMDIQLPVMNGIEATKMIRSIEKEQRIGVLPMSSSFLRQQQAAAAATAATLLNQQEPSSLELEVAAVANDMHRMQEEDAITPSIFRSPVIIVALTASSLESDRHTALAAGCNDFLTKPVSLEWLEKKIIEWGCMQALIDFEGWRRWKKKSNTDDTKKLATAKEALDATDFTQKQIETEKKRIESLSRKPNKQGVMLPGISNLIKSRRSSSIYDLSHNLKRSQDGNRQLKPSRSESDTQVILRSSSDPQKGDGPDNQDKSKTSSSKSEQKAIA